MTQARTSEVDGDVERLTATFDHHDPGLGFEVLHQVYRQLQMGCPVPKTAAHGGFAVVTRHSDIVAVEKNTAVFASSGAGVLHPPHEGRPASIPIEFDGAEHLGYRKLFMEVLSAHRVRKIEPYLRDLVHRVLDGFAQGDDDDFVQNVAVQIPVRAVGRLLGFGEDANEDLQEFATTVLENAGTPAMLEGLQQLDSIALEHCIQRRDDARDDYLSALVHLDFGGRLLSDDELLNIIRSFVFAGFETTARAIGSFVGYLVTHPPLQDRMRSGEWALEGIVEEGLRMFPPVQNMFRTATTTTELNGTALDAGERLMLLYAAANRDPDQFDDPEAFCPTRPNPRKHLAFGVGPHYCAGAALARAEITILLEAMVDRPPLALTGTPRHNPHLMMGQMMGVEYLPVRFKGEN
ncbi:cytochrome P450 [Mycolicibacterium sp.]|uniref:cytochrome P450 n=1 Tax=Mycolicibacterium sp. TaxID=2320850 RepID=UPI003D112696